MQIVCICKIGCILSMNSHLSCLRMIDHLCHDHAIMPASTNPPFLLSCHVTNDRGTFHWETFKTYEKSMRQYWSLMFCKQTGISSLWPINNTEKKRKVSNHNLFNLPDVPWSTIGGDSPLYAQWAHCRGIFYSFSTRTSRGIGCESQNRASTDDVIQTWSPFWLLPVCFQ